MNLNFISALKEEEKLFHCWVSAICSRKNGLILLHVVTKINSMHFLYLITVVISNHFYMILPPCQSVNYPLTYKILQCSKVHKLIRFKRGCLSLTIASVTQVCINIWCQKGAIELSLDLDGKTMSCLCFIKRRHHVLRCLDRIIKMNNSFISIQNLCFVRYLTTLTLHLCTMPWRILAVSHKGQL